MGVGAAVKVIRWRILPTLLVTSVLWNIQYTCNDGLKGTYTVTFFIEHEGGDGPPGVGAVAGLTADSDSSAAPAVLILGSGDGASGHRHD